MRKISHETFFAIDASIEGRVKRTGFSFICMTGDVKSPVPAKTFIE